ncbi:MAG: ABC transporter substrate-binding protein [Acetobacteraceae bacterium]|nr:ABC transporter substrate-binding protein [Acetobacteraceae bacterium]
MKRRVLLQAAAALALPNIVAAQNTRLLRFMPHADLASLDPMWTTADITRNFSSCVYDTLYGLDANFRPHPQMVQGHNVEQDGKLWRLTLREGLRFHDGSAVLAKDAVASIKRWGVRDPYGSALLARTDEISAPSDKTIEIRLKRPFSQVPDALGQYACVIMPERLAQIPATTQITEVMGSGPFKFAAGERVPGSRVVYVRNPDYIPRNDGAASFYAGPKIVHFDRVEWTFVPDSGTSAAALTNGEYDWWEQATIDLIAMLRRNPKLTIEIKNNMGSIGCIRFNSLNPPFDNPAIRRVVLEAVNQQDFMEAVAGAEPSLIRLGAGILASASPMASDAGAEITKGRKDHEALKKQLAAAGYDGRKIVLLGPSTIPTLHAQSQVVDDLLRKIGFNVDYQSLEWGTVVQRRASKEPIDKGGWNIFITNLGGTGNIFVPASNAIRSGPNAWFGWPDAPKLEALRESWLEAPDFEAAKRIAREMQMQFWRDVPYVPTGEFSQPTAYFNHLKDIQTGWPVFHSVRRV